MELQPHQQRVVDEKSDLDEKREKLEFFKNGSFFLTLPLAEQERLNKQADAMALYSSILDERITAFS